MNKDVQITTEQLRQAVHGDMEKLLDEVTVAVNTAPDGAVISGSEEAVRNAMARFRTLVYERAIQLRSEAAQAAFPPRKSDKGKRYKNKGPQEVSHLTANGTIRIRRTVYWYAGEGSDPRLERWLGIYDTTVSVAARELCCRATVTGPSFRKSAENLERLGQIRVSSTRLRHIVEDEGQQAIRCRDTNLIRPVWDVSDCKTGVNGPTRMMVGSDGVMVPVITESEKRKRRENRRPRRRKRGKARMAVVHRRRRKSKQRRRCRGADGPYKETKIVTFYDQANECQHAAGTAGDHQALGRLMRREAMKLGLHKADEKISISDGAKWIRKQFQVRLPMLDAMVLDYYHLSEHVAKAANVCFGQGGEKAEQWRKETLSAVWEEGPAAMLTHIHQTRTTVRAKTKREELRKLENYVAARTEMLDYPAFRAQGFDIGSGPTEAFCKTLTARLKGSGMRWDSPNAEGMMALAALDQSGQWNTYWALQNALAA